MSQPFLLSESHILPDSSRSTAVCAGRCDGSRGEITEGWKYRRRMTGCYCPLELKQVVNLLNKRLLCSCDANHLQLVRSWTLAGFPLQTQVQPKDQKKTHKQKSGAEQRWICCSTTKTPNEHIYAFPGGRDVFSTSSSDLWILYEGVL